MFTFNTKVGIPVYVIEEDEKISADQIEEDFAYVICDKGVFAKRKNFLYQGLFKVEGDANFLGEVDAAVETQTELKIPENLFHSIERFFKRIYDKLQTEVECFLYYNTETEKWAYCVPQQTVTGSHVSYDESKGATYILEDNLEEGLDELPAEGNWNKVGSIHSHAAMGAFHSGTDDKDEFGFDGIHITIGNLNSGRYTYACRVMCGKTATKKEIEDVVDFPTPPGAYPESLEDRVSKETYSVGKTYSGAASYSSGSTSYTGYDWRSAYGQYGYEDDDGYPAVASAKSTGASVRSVIGFEDVDDARGKKGSKRGRRAARYQYANGLMILQEEK